MDSRRSFAPLLLQGGRGVMRGRLLPPTCWPAGGTVASQQHGSSYSSCRCHEISGFRNVARWAGFAAGAAAGAAAVARLPLWEDVEQFQYHHNGRHDHCGCCMDCGAPGFRVRSWRFAVPMAPLSMINNRAAGTSIHVAGLYFAKCSCMCCAQCVMIQSAVSVHIIVSIWNSCVILQMLQYFVTHSQ